MIQEMFRLGLSNGVVRFHSRLLQFRDRHPDDGNFRYAVDMEGYGALQFLTEERLLVHPC